MLFRSCMWLSATARNLLVMQANRAQISLVAAMLPPCPMQNTCRALCSSATACSTACGESAFWVPLMAVMNSASVVTGALGEGRFVLFFPTELHKPGLVQHGCVGVRKAVVKIRMEG